MNVTDVSLNLHDDKIVTQNFVMKGKKYEALFMVAVGLLSINLNLC